MCFARFIYLLFNCSAQNPRRQAAAGLFFVRTVLVPSRRLARIRAEPETAGARLEGAPSCPPTTTDSRLRPEARWRLQRGMLGLRVRFRDNADRQRVASRLGRSVGRSVQDAAQPGTAAPGPRMHGVLPGNAAFRTHNGHLVVLPACAAVRLPRSAHLSMLRVRRGKKKKKIE